MNAGKSLGEAAGDAMAFALVMMVLVWFLAGCVGEWIRRRWGFFCQTCGHGHFGAGRRFACGGDVEDGEDCPCPKVLP